MAETTPNPFSGMGTGELFRAEPSTPEDIQLLNDAIDGRLSKISEKDLITWRTDRGASRLAALRIEKELYERSLGRRQYTGDGEASSASGLPQSGFLGTWKEFFTVLGIILVFVIMVARTATGSGAGHTASGAASLLGTVTAIYILTFFTRRRNRR